VDGNETNLKRQFIPVIREDLANGTPHELVNGQTAKLDILGYKSQIFPRPINFFYMEEGLRERIEKKGTQFFVLNTDLKFEEDELFALVEKSPEKFSPNVVLRPLYQEQILPNLAYIGGPAEVIYWLQLKSMFDHFGTPFPAVMPRNFAAVLDAPIVKKMKKLKLSHKDLFREFTDWKNEYISDHSKVDIHLGGEKKKLQEIFDQAVLSVKSIDPTLENAYTSAKVRATKILDQLSVKVRKAEERKFGEELDRMKAVQAYFFPGGSPQERVENFMKFYLSDKDFVEKLFGLFDPFDFDFMVLTQDDK
jgi:bacillithiol biosynthesis cysteine-adding enzyme BshC